jgi:hypothetical protein
MTRILEYLRDYFHDEWNPRLFLVAGAFLAFCFVINYEFDFEQRFTDGVENPLQQFLFYFFFYGIPYAVTLVVAAATSKKQIVASRKHFSVLYFFAFALLAFYVVLHNLPALLLKNPPAWLQSVPRHYHLYFTRYASNVLPAIVIALPLFLYWLRHDREDSRFYGFSTSAISLTTYFAILLILMPIIVAVSFGKDFQAAYPRYKFGLPENATGMEKNLLIAGFEFCYGLDFIAVELLFRGFMVMAFKRHLGSGAILPMVVVYCLIHFQKPMGEAIGAIAGGLVLGVISYRTKSIYGGVILHLGVAYMMEIAGTIHLILLT